MICERCLRLWIEYDESIRLEATETQKAVSEAIRIHDAMAHPEPHPVTINPSADKARAIGA